MYAELSAASAPPSGEPRYGFVFDALPMVLGAGVLTELVDDLPIYPIPRSHPGLAGVLNLRGAIVPLFTPLSARSTPRHGIRPHLHRALVLGQGAQRAGLLLAQLPQLVALRPPAVAVAVPDGPYAACTVRAWVATEAGTEQHWWEMDLPALLQRLAQP